LCCTVCVSEQRDYRDSGSTVWHSAVKREERCNIVWHSIETCQQQGTAKSFTELVIVVVVVVAVLVVVLLVVVGLFNADADWQRIQYFFLVVDADVDSWSEFAY